MGTASNKSSGENKKVQSLISDINEGSEEKLIAALKSLQIHGDTSVLVPLANRWVKGLSEKTESVVVAFISDIKLSDSAAIVMTILKDKKFSTIRQQLLTTVWNSKVDYSEFLADFVHLAVHGNFMEALECLTIIENMEGPFEEFQFLDAQVEFSDFAEMTGVDEQKRILISEIAQIIKDLESGHIEF